MSKSSVCFCHLESMELFEKLAQKRKERKISFEELSERTGVSISTLKKVLTGVTSDPAFTLIDKIAFALGVKLDELSMLEQNPFTPEALEIARKYDDISDEHSRSLIKNLVDFEYNHFSSRPEELTDRTHTG